MRKLLSAKKCLYAALLALFVYIPNASAQNQLPPAHTYYTDGNGGDSRRVKERWSEDANGQKNGTYIKYDREGKVLDKYAYLHGVKDGPASYTDEYGNIKWRMTCRFVGLYKQGNQVGFWKIYDNPDYVISDQPKAVIEFNSAGDFLRRVSLKAGKPVEMVSLNKLGEVSGSAAIYANGNEKTFASGRYLVGKPVGVWQNATLDNNGNIIYAQGHKVEFENGVAVTITNSAGKIRSMKDEARKNEEIQAKYEADKLAAEASAPKHYDRIEVDGMSFNPDSYLMTKKGIQTLTSIAHAVNERNASPQKVSTIYLSTTAGDMIRERSRNDSTEKMMYILSLNRALAVKTMLKEQLDDKTIKIVSYACSYNLNTTDNDIREIYDDGGTQMSFDEPLPHAQAAYVKLVDKYGMHMMDYFTPNNLMRKSILEVADAYFEDEIVRQEMLSALFPNPHFKEEEKKEYFNKIPHELWVPTPFSTKYGEDNPATFRAEVETRFAKLNKKYHIADYKEGKEISPSVLFHKELKEYLAQKAD